MAAVRKRKEDLDDVRRRVIDTVESAYDVTKQPLWKELEALSTRTELDSVFVDPAGVLFEDGGSRFKGLANIFVSLRYDFAKDDIYRTSDGFIAGFRGHVDGKRVVIDEMSVDTSHFYD